MRIRLRVPVSALLFFITPGVTHAQSAPAQTAPTIHETVVVTATGPVVVPDASAEGRGP